MEDQGRTVDPLGVVRILEGIVPAMKKDYAGQGDSPLSGVLSALVGARNAVRRIAELEAERRDLDRLADCETRSVTLCGHNPSFDGPGYKIEIEEFSTEPSTFREFTGHSLAECVRSALQALEGGGQ